MVFSRCVPALFYSPEAEIRPCPRDAGSHEPVYSTGGAFLSAGVSALSAMGGVRDGLTVPFIKEKPMGRGGGGREDAVRFSKTVGLTQFTLAGERNLFSGYYF